MEKQLNLPEVPEAPNRWERFSKFWAPTGWWRFLLALVGATMRMLVLGAGAFILSMWLVHGIGGFLDDFRFVAAMVLVYCAYGWGWILEKAGTIKLKEESNV